MVREEEAKEVVREEEEEVVREGGEEEKEVVSKKKEVGQEEVRERGVRSINMCCPPSPQEKEEGFSDG